MNSESTGAVRAFERLSQLDGYGVDKRQPDPRGWTVVTVDGHTIGEVKDLLVDTARMKATFLAVEIDLKLFSLHRDPHVWIPLTRVHRETNRRRLVVDWLTRERLEDLLGARDQQMVDFWTAWWSRDANDVPDVAGAAPPTVTGEELRRAIEQIGPGEQVRIPIRFEEEIIVERRPVNREG
jgi:hypothetical protein